MLPKRPLTVIGLVLLVAVMPLGVEIAVYSRIGLPPLESGAVNATVACPDPLVAIPIAGAPGTVAGVTALDAVAAGPEPSAFIAFTVNVYALPFVSPVTVNGERPFAVMLPGEEVTVYDKIGVPPSLEGDEKLTVASPLSGVAVTAVGAPGTVLPSMEHFAKYMEGMPPAALKFPPM